MTRLVLMEPDLTPCWFPFGVCRPIAELRAGAWLIRERWEGVANATADTIFGGPHLASFVEDGVPPVATAGPVEGPVVIGRSDFVPSGERLELPKQPARLINDEATVGWWVPEGAHWDADAAGNELPIEGMVLHGAYDFITALEHLLIADAADFTHERGDPIPDASIVLGDPIDVVLLGAHVEPGVVFDVRGGAIVLEQHSIVRAGSRLEGPLFVGPGTEILGGDIRHSSFGPRCKVRGEISSSVFLGYGNKAHEGFLGHSVVGRWVNLGAGTTTSNLKNTYGPVRLDVHGQRIETGRTNLGTLFGDHAKTAIGTLLETGTVIGAGANVFGLVRPPKYLAPFAWGADGTRMTRDGFLAIVERTLPRRDVTVTDTLRASMLALYDHAAQ